jgi:lipopolysaccharide export system permease protein
MKFYSFYLTRKLIASFAVIITTLVLLIWFSKAMSFIKFVTDKGVQISDFLNLFLLILPWLLLIIVPIALFIAVLTTYNQMSNHNEITILKNSGLSNYSIAKPAINLAILCCIFCFFVSLFLMPLANKKLRFVKSDFRVNYANIIISPGIFENLNSLTLYVKDRDEQGNLLGVFIYDSRNSEYANIITSDSGVMRQGKNVLLYLNRGTAQRFNYASRKTDVLNFDSYVVNLSDNNKASVNFRWKAQEMYVHELLNPSPEASEKDLADYIVELHQRFTYPLFSVVLSLIAMSCLLNGKFSRYGNARHNVVAFIFAAIFIISTMFGYKVIEASPHLSFLLYLNLLIFVLVSLYFLKLKNHK